MKKRNTRTRKSLLFFYCTMIWCITFCVPLFSFKNPFKQMLLRTWISWLWWYIWKYSNGANQPTSEHGMYCAEPCVQHVLYLMVDIKSAECHHIRIKCYHRKIFECTFLSSKFHCLLWHCLFVVFFFFFFGWILMTKNIVILNLA